MRVSNARMGIDKKERKAVSHSCGKFGKCEQHNEIPDGLINNKTF